MKEKELILNLYYAYILIQNMPYIVGLGCKTYKKNGSEDSKLRFLQKMAAGDFSKSVRENIAKRFAVCFQDGDKIEGVLPLVGYNELDFNHKLNMFEELFEKVEAEQGVQIPVNPLVCITGIRLTQDSDNNLTGKYEVVIDEVVHA